MVWMDLTGATGTANTPTPTPTGGVGVFTPTPTATSWPATTMTCANMTGLVTLDGDLKEWDGVEQITVNKDTSAVVTPLPGPLASDAQARVKCGWDADYLYVAAVLDDDVVVADSQSSWLDDSLEVGIDAGNDAIPWGPDDHEWSVRANGEVLLFNQAEAPGVMAYAATAAGGGGGGFDGFQAVNPGIGKGVKPGGVGAAQPTEKQTGVYEHPAVVAGLFFGIGEETGEGRLDPGRAFDGYGVEPAQHPLQAPGFDLEAGLLVLAGLAQVGQVGPVEFVVSPVYHRPALPAGSAPGPQG